MEGKTQVEGIIETLGDVHILAGGRGLAEHQLRLLEVTEESNEYFKRAKALLESGEEDSAILYLEKAVRKSPAFRDAVGKLVELYKNENNEEKAHSTLEDYLELLPEEIDLILEDANLLMMMGRKKPALARIQEVLDLDPENTEALSLKEKSIMMQETLQKEFVVQEAYSSFPLPYEIVINCILNPLFRRIREKNPREHEKRIRIWRQWFSISFLLIVTIGSSAVFFLHYDLIMAVTCLAMGLLWGTAISTTFKVRKIIAESRVNFSAFIRTSRGDYSGKLFDRLVTPIFGDYPQECDSVKALVEVFLINWFRISIVVILSIAYTVIFYIKVKMYSPFGLIVDGSFLILQFFISLSIFYLLSCLALFHLMLNKLRFQKIHFSLVQHPKLSIRYLSSLSRRISYPLLLIYTLGAFTLYLGPFKANMAFIGGITILLLTICYLYYSTIFLVRRVIIRNKWRLISQFSVHLDEPFNSLITEAKKEHADRLRDLTEMRNFLDSMDVWAEKKSILFITSLFYICVLLVATVGMSNIMTRRLVPKLARYETKWIEHKENKEKEKNSQPILVKLDKDSLEGVPKGEIGELAIKVSGVDDGLFVVWAKNKEDLFNTDNYNYGKPDLPRTVYEYQPGATFQRCDWYEGTHGAMSLKIQAEEEINILLVAYNKIYKGFLWMGGGKFSYEVHVSIAGGDIFKVRKFSRINTLEIGYVALLTIKRLNDNVVSCTVSTGPNNALAGRRDYYKWLVEQLKKEKGAKYPMADYVPGSN